MQTSISAPQPGNRLGLIAAAVFVLACPLAVYLLVARYAGQLQPLYYLPALLINTLLLIGFGRTLLPGRRPLISALAARARGSIDAATARYTRRLTAVWTLFFAAVIGELLLLAWLAPADPWPLYVNYLNYLLTLSLFVGEFWLRRYFLAHVEHPRFFDYLRFLAHTDWRGVVGR